METCGDWQKNNREKCREYGRKYEAAHKEERHEKYVRYKDRHRELMKRWSEEHRELSREYTRRYALRHPDRIRAQWAKWYQRNRAYETVRQQNKRARRQSAPGSFTDVDVQSIYEYQDGKCFYCQRPVGDDFHRDHFIPLARGGTNDWTNIVVACPSCNFSKRDKLPEEFDKFISTDDVSGGGLVPPPSHT